MKNNNISDTEREIIPFESWDGNYLHNFISTNIFNRDEYLCLPSSGLTLQGSFSSDFSNFFAITVEYEPNEEWGMTYDQYVNDVKYVELMFIIANEYIDPKNYDNPVQVEINDHYYVGVDPRSATFMNLFVQK